MDARPTTQSDFNTAARGLRIVADQLELCPNMPALDASVELMNRMDQMLEQMRLLHAKFDALDKKFDISNRNMMVRLENSIVVTGEMVLAPLYSFQTGEQITGCPSTLAELESLSTADVAQLLRSLNETVPRGHEERRRKLKLLFGIRTRAI